MICSSHKGNQAGRPTYRVSSKPVHEYIPVGPFNVKVKLTDDVKGENPDLLVAGKNIKAEVSEGWSIFSITSITDHEVVVLT